MARPKKEKSDYPLNPYLRNGDEYREGEDRRHKDVGLTNEEANYILSVCQKYQNFRDELDDMYQTCLIALFEGFRRQAERGEPIRHRKGYIRRVVFNILNYRYIQSGRHDFLRKCLNNTHQLVDLEDGHLPKNSEEPTPILSMLTEARPGDIYSVLEWDIVLQDVFDRVLDDEERLLMHRYEIEGLTQKEIARIHGGSQSYISVRLRKARERVMQALRETLEDVQGR